MTISHSQSILIKCREDPVSGCASIERAAKSVTRDRPPLQPIRSSRALFRTRFAELCRTQALDGIQQLALAKSTEPAGSCPKLTANPPPRGIDIPI
jgi:hypothetical protein